MVFPIDKTVYFYGDKKIKYLTVFVLCLSLSYVCSGTHTNLNSAPSRVKRQNSSFDCSPNQFRCSNNDCIEGFLFCNGRKDCADGSDETKEQCSKIVCPSYLTKCKYGACVDRSLRCNKIEECIDGSDEIGCKPTLTKHFLTKGCLTLTHPPNGKRSFISKDVYVENISVPASTAITITCNSGYRAFDLDWEGMAYCYRGKWFGDISEDVCKRTCPPLNYPTAKTSCSYNFRDLDCSKAVEGTTATIECLPFTNRTNRSMITCTNGTWTPNIESCVPGQNISIHDIADGYDEDAYSKIVPTSKPSIKITTETLESIDYNNSLFLSGGCLTLKHPPNGKCSFISNELYLENIAVPKSTTIKITCNAGYRATGLNSEGIAYCSNGKWVGDVFEDVCKKICPPLNNQNIKTSCSYNSRDLDCSKAVEGTTATTDCQPFYAYRTIRSKMSCTNGRWIPLGSCLTECGTIKTLNAPTLDIGETTAKPGEYPWVVAIYKDEEHVCAGSIISQVHVLSAAHCFTHIDTSNFVISAGKYFKDFKDMRDNPIEQIRTIELHIHHNYLGKSANYQYDIAVLRVREFALNFYVQPVCIDWNQEYEENSLQTGNKGVIAGWEHSRDGKDSIHEIQKVILPFQPKEKCREHLHQEFFKLYNTPDKICAGYISNDTNVCKIASGGGYYFRSNSKFYIRGIAGLLPKDGCSKNLYAFYTKVSLYIDWLADITRSYM